MSRLAALRDLPWQARLQLVRAAAGMAVVNVSLRVVGFRRTQRWIENLTRHRHPRTAVQRDLSEARELARLTCIAGRHGPLEATCLRQALFLLAALRHRGLRPELRLGVAPGNGPFTAHAWIELEGECLLAGDATHQPFVSSARRQA